MSAASMRHHKRSSLRRIAAKHFLSNISLDGTHTDTNYSFHIWRNHRLKTEQPQPNEPVKDCKTTLNSPSDPKVTVKSSHTKTNDTSNDKNNTAYETPLSELMVQNAKPRMDNNFNDNDSIQLSEKTITPTKRWRASTYSSYSEKERSRRRLGQLPVENVHRSSSYSEKERTSRRKMLQLSMENVPPIIRETVEKTGRHVACDMPYDPGGNPGVHILNSVYRKLEYADRSSRRSSSLSGDSNDPHDYEVRFLSPDSRRKIKNERVLIVSGRKVPFVVCSTVPYIRQIIALRYDGHDELPPVRSRHHSGTKSISSLEDMFLLGQKVIKGEDGQDVSYSQLLEPSKKKQLQRTVSESRLPGTENHSGRIYTRSISEDPRMLSARASIANSSLERGRIYARSVSDDPKMLSARASITNSSLERVLEEDEEDPYDPSLLDDPELQSGGYRTVLNFSSYMTSVIDYVKPSTLKKELNEKFKERFPNIQLSLTKFRSLKKEMRSIGHVKCGVDLWSVAQAYVFFEKLILKLLITKQNRKLCAGACLMLSAKLNDLKGPELSKLIVEIEDDFRIPRKEMLAYEFATLVALEFSLHITDSDIYPHYQRLLYQS